MDIVDTQVHLGPGGAAKMLAAMDALGIQSVLVDETWIGSPSDPKYPVGDGGFRASAPTAELAAWTYPGRFAYVTRVDRRDPDARSLIRMARDADHVRALRLLPSMNRVEVAAFADGEYDTIFDGGSICGLPVFVAIGGRTHLLARYLEKFPKLTVIVCHCGMPPSPTIRKLLAQMEGLPDSEAYWEGLGNAPLMDSLDKVLRLADYPNVAIKWAHASAIFGVPGYPNEALRPYLRRMLDAFGAERLMWASDYSTIPTGETWAELLFSVRNNPDLTDAERESLLGGTARRWLNWAPRKRDS